MIAISPVKRLAFLHLLLTLWDFLMIIMLSSNAFSPSISLCSLQDSAEADQYRRRWASRPGLRGFIMMASRATTILMNGINAPLPLIDLDKISKIVADTYNHISSVYSEKH